MERRGALLYLGVIAYGVNILACNAAPEVTISPPTPRVEPTKPVDTPTAVSTTVTRRAEAGEMGMLLENFNPKGSDTDIKLSFGEPTVTFGNITIENDSRNIIRINPDNLAYWAKKCQVQSQTGQVLLVIADRLSSGGASHLRYDPRSVKAALGIDQLKEDIADGFDKRYTVDPNNRSTDLRNAVVLWVNIRAIDEICGGSRASALVRIGEQLFFINAALDISTGTANGYEKGLLTGQQPLIFTLELPANKTF